MSRVPAPTKPGHRTSLASAQFHHELGIKSLVGHLQCSGIILQWIGLSHNLQETMVFTTQRKKQKKISWGFWIPGGFPFNILQPILGMLAYRFETHIWSDWHVSGPYSLGCRTVAKDLLWYATAGCSHHHASPWECCVSHLCTTMVVPWCPLRVMQLNETDQSYSIVSKSPDLSARVSQVISPYIASQRLNMLECPWILQHPEAAASIVKSSNDLSAMCHWLPSMTGSRCLHCCHWRILTLWCLTADCWLTLNHRKAHSPRKLSR